MNDQLELKLPFKFEDMYVDRWGYVHMDKAKHQPGPWHQEAKVPVLPPAPVFYAGDQGVLGPQLPLHDSYTPIDASKYFSIKIKDCTATPLPDVIQLPHIKTDKRRGDWIQTYTGRVFYPLDPRPEEIWIKDIAWALSRQCRYAGHTTQHYSVAEHSVVVSHNVAPHKALAALLHDASEAYAVDIPRPMKKDMPEYKAIEKNIEIAVATRFNLEYPWDDEIMLVDGAMIRYERASFMNPMLRSDIDWTYPNEHKLNNIKLYGFDPQEAYELFMDRYRELTEG